MAPTVAPGDGNERLDRERGRTDDRAALRRHLAIAAPGYLLGALENLVFGPEELTLTLANRGATGEILARISGNRSWMRARESKLGLVSHPNTPFAVARGFLPHLSWRELADLAGNLSTPPLLRREAEKLVRTRLPELTLGERITLARAASRGLVELLRDERDAAILQALAGNPRATEADLLRILARPELPPEFLGWLADQSTWGQRRALRLAIVRHSRTPHASALRLTQALSSRDLDALSRDDDAPRLVRIAAARRAAVDTDSSASLQSPADRRHPGSRGLSTSR